MHCCSSAGSTFKFPCGRTAIVAIIIINICIINYSSIVIDSRGVPVIVSVHISVIHSVVWEECPVTSGQIYIYVNMYTRTHWCPSVISTT